jgi:hypothetical protein
MKSIDYVKQKWLHYNNNSEVFPRYSIDIYLEHYSRFTVAEGIWTSSNLFITFHRSIVVYIVVYTWSIGDLKNGC